MLIAALLVIPAPPFLPASILNWLEGLPPVPIHISVCVSGSR
jgi:hypothetical protein